MNWPILPMAVAAGALVAVQVALNGRMQTAIGSPGLSALISLGVGLIVLLPVVATGQLGHPRLGGLAQAPWWAWLGGVCGATFLVATVIGLPRIGAALMLAAVLLGQLAMGLVIDTLGWFGVAPIALSPMRLVGMAVVTCGLALMAHGAE